MKKILFAKVLIVFLTLSGFNRSVSAQNEVIDKGHMILNAGIGAGNYISHPGYSVKLLPIVFSLEYGVVDLFDSRGGIGIGGYAAYTLFGAKDANRLNQKVSDLIVGVRGMFHYEFIEKLDTYAGVMLGYDIVSHSQPDNLPGSTFRPGLFAGARYYITNNLGVFAELGYNTAPLELGVCYEF